jgi:CRP-like cAMP-binding protein
MAALMARAVRRSRALVHHLAITQVTGVETRIAMVLWEFAERWGHVRPDGVALSLGLTHETLARLVGARRPSVTTALRALAEQGRVTQEGPGRWVLHGPAPGTSAG